MKTVQDLINELSQFSPDMPVKLVGLGDQAEDNVEFEILSPEEFDGVVYIDFLLEK
jgi:hypothetical protein